MIQNMKKWIRKANYNCFQILIVSTMLPLQMIEMPLCKCLQPKCLFGSPRNLQRWIKFFSCWFVSGIDFRLVFMDGYPSNWEAYIAFLLQWQNWKSVSWYIHEDTQLYYEVFSCKSKCINWIERFDRAQCWRLGC